MLAVSFVGGSEDSVIIYVTSKGVLGLKGLGATAW